MEGSWDEHLICQCHLIYQSKCIKSINEHVHPLHIVHTLDRHITRQC